VGNVELKMNNYKYAIWEQDAERVFGAGMFTCKFYDTKDDADFVINKYNLNRNADYGFPDFTTIQVPANADLETYKPKW
tara:strand:+ start:766 stop:1002 length:237 start_codon:yes stop_codon:yes gene_type:complete